jgi:hypothetical protein
LGETEAMSDQKINIQDEVGTIVWGTRTGGKIRQLYGLLALRIKQRDTADRQVKGIVRRLREMEDRYHREELDKSASAMLLEWRTKQDMLRECRQSEAGAF